MQSDQVGQRIRAAREAAGLSQGGLADLLGVRPHTVYRYERQGLSPSTDGLLRIAQACGVSMEWILTGDGDGPPSESLEATGTEG